jgi:hypothetical protein
MMKQIGMMGIPVALAFAWFLIPALCSSQNTFEFVINSKMPVMEFRLIWNDDPQYKVVQKIEVRRKGSPELLQILDARMDEQPVKTQSDYFNAEDINFDGYKDIKLQIMWGATGNRIFDFYLFDPNIGKFSFSPSFSTLLNPIPNPERKELEVFWTGGMGGNIYSRQTFKVIGNRPVLLREEVQNWNKEESCFIKIVKERRNNELIVIKEEKIPAPEWKN